MIWSPGFSRWISAGAAAYCGERLIRLKPGLLSGDSWLTCSNFISRWISAEVAAYCGERLIRLKPGLQASVVQIKNPNFIKLADDLPDKETHR